MEFTQNVLTWGDKQKNPIIYAICIVMICLMLPFIILGEFVLYILRSLP